MPYTLISYSMLVRWRGWEYFFYNFILYIYRVDHFLKNSYLDIGNFWKNGQVETSIFRKAFLKAQIKFDQTRTYKMF